MPPLSLALLVVAPPLGLIAAGLIPPAFANRHCRILRDGVVALLALGLAVGLAAAWQVIGGGAVDQVLVAAPAPVPLNLGVFFDTLTAVMYLLITVIGLIIARYSVRALDGEAGQGGYFRWLAVTIGAVLLLVVARNLVMFTAAWMLTSVGLHFLLTHYPDRPWALWAARKKFLVSRLGDGLLLVALALTLWCFGSTDYAVIFEQAAASRAGGGTDGCLPAIALLLVLGAMTKSAQFPFHTWLPDTMESPTPVSALMHAGIINAGGFLVIRLSPLVAASPAALHLLAVTGALTALLGGLVMLTQTSIKRALAFSTVAQMGFMMLQCGLGAFSAALVHIVAHAIYKAHAFLANGSALEAAARGQAAERRALPGTVQLGLVPVAAVIAAGIVAAVFAVADIHVATKPGGLVLGSVLVVALTTLVWHGCVSGVWPVALAAVGAAAGVAAGYALVLTGVDRLLAASAVAADAMTPSIVDVVLGVGIVLAFVGVFAIQAAATTLARLPLVRALHVHAANGFYCDIPARQLTARVWGLTTPVP